MNLCSNCNQAPAKVKGRCRNCYNYHYIYRRERPARLWNRRNQRCSNCKQPRARGKKQNFCKGRCATCYRYWRRYEKERPLKPKITHCSNCRHERQPKEHFSRGRCLNCYHYLYQHGFERPRWCWNPAVEKPEKEEITTAADRSRLCDCGQPATQQATMQIAGPGGHAWTEVYDLCDECHQFEQEMREELQERGMLQAA